MEEVVDVRQMHPTPARGELPLPESLDQDLIGAMPQLHELPGAAVTEPTQRQQQGKTERGSGRDETAEIGRASSLEIRGGEAAALERLRV